MDADSAEMRASRSSDCMVTSFALSDTSSTSPSSLSLSSVAVRSSDGMRRVSVALPPLEPSAAYSLRASTRPPTDSVMRTASRAPSMGSSTVTVT